MRTTSILLAVIGSLLATGASAQVAQCTVPNTLVNGQVADATDVMENFNAVANCVEETRTDAVTHNGTPAPGEIAVFTSPTGISGGDLSGDVSTAGGTVTTLAPSGVTPGTYTSANITVDAKGRVTAASNGSGGSGGGSWTILYANTALTNPTPNITIDVTGYSDVMVIGRGVTAAQAGLRAVQVSVDGGTTFYKTAGDYEGLADSGIVSQNFAALNHLTGTTAARSFGGIIHALNLPGIPKFMEQSNHHLNRWFVASFNPITHIRIAVIAVSGGPDIPMTGGQVFVLAR